LSLRQHDADTLAIFHGRDGVPADGIVFEAEGGRRLRGVHLGDQPARRGVPACKRNAGGLANRAAPAIAANEVLRTQHLAVG